MGAYECPRCGNQRSRRRHGLCTVCSFRDDLVGDHQRGLHDDKLNVSCDVCKPRHNEQLREGEAGAYVDRVLAARPLTPVLARFLLRLDREGFPAAQRHGEKGSRAMIRLHRQGHLEIEWFKGVPSLKISAQSRHKALELLASSDSPRARVERPRDAVSAPKHTTARTSTSHANCDHESTPKARAKCRAARANPHG